MNARKTVVRVFWAEQYDGNWPAPYDGKLMDFRDWVNEIIEEIPEEHRGSARLEISSNTSYDQSLASIEVTYSRPETSEERRAREASDLARKQAAEQGERRTYETLKAKFG